MGVADDGTWRELLDSEPELRRWQARINAWSGPEADSALADDDETWTPFPLSAVVLNKMASVTDHLLAVQVLSSGKPHPLAPFTLLRPALLGASQAVWLLDAEPAKRRARAAHFAFAFGQDYRTYLRSAREAEQLDYGPAGIVLGRIIMREWGLMRLRSALPKPGPSADTSVIRFAASSAISAASQGSDDDRKRWPPQAEAFWRNMSGDVHSSPWAAMARRSSAEPGTPAGAGAISAIAIRAELEVTGNYFHVALVTARHAWTLFDALNSGC